jgi:hypothetical protein
MAWDHLVISTEAPCCQDGADASHFDLVAAAGEKTGLAREFGISRDTLFPYLKAALKGRNEGPPNGGQAGLRQLTLQRS